MKYHYINGNMGMTSSGSFTRDSSRWIMFNEAEARRMVAGGIKPWGATRLGIFVDVETNQALKVAK